ncbi:hypothetical protein Tco_0015417 [Tanacetum coccineum]
MALCINLQQRVLDLEKTKTAQAKEIVSLKKRVKKLEKKRSRTHGLKRPYKVGISARVESYGNEEGLGEEDASKQERRIHDIDADEDITLINDQDDADMFDVNTLTMQKFRKKLMLLKPNSVPVSAANVSTKVSAATTTTATILTPRKGIIITELGIPTTTRTISSQQPSQAKVQDKGKSIMVEEPEKMKKKDQISFDEQEAKRAEEKRNKPPTQAQQRKIMTELMEESSKKAEAEIAQESSSKRAGDEL